MEQNITFKVDVELNGINISSFETPLQMNFTVGGVFKLNQIVDEELIKRNLLDKQFGVVTESLYKAVLIVGVEVDLTRKLDVDWSSTPVAVEEFVHTTTLIVSELNQAEEPVATQKPEGLLVVHKGHDFKEEGKITLFDIHSEQLITCYKDGVFIGVVSWNRQTDKPFVATSVIDWVSFGNESSYVTHLVQEGIRKGFDFYVVRDNLRDKSIKAIEKKSRNLN